MRGTLRGFVVGAATALVVVPVVAIAQEAPELEKAPQGEEVPELDDVPAPEQQEDDAPAITSQDADDAVDATETERPEGSGPPWWAGEPHTGDGPPPWAPAHGFRVKSGEVAEGDRPGGGPPFEAPGPPPWAGQHDGDDEDDGTGPPWYEGDPHDGNGPPPWAGRGGPRGHAGSGGD